MKIKLSLLACILASPAFAASSVSLYGVIDAGILAQQARHGGDTTIEAKSGFTAGPRWGLKGVEDLGNGYRVGFILEQGFNIDTGTEGAAGKAFNRESALYIQGNFGKVTFGRLGTLGFAQSTGILKGATFATTWGASGWNRTNYGVNFDRADNAVAYTSPSFSGLTLHAMYSNKLSGSDEEKWSKNNHYYGLGLKYTKDKFDGSLIFEVKDNKEAETKEERKAMYHITAGASYNLGAVKPMAIYQFATQENLYSQHYFGLGVHTSIAGGTARLGGKYIIRNARGSNKVLEKNETDKKAGVWTIGAGYEYPLSKRTNLWAYAGFADGQKAWKDKSSVYFNGWQVGTGIKHTF